MKISFIVLTYNRVDALLAVLHSLAQQCSEDHQIVIADDGSRAEQVQLLQQRCPAFRCPVIHVWHPDTGFTIARARNLAVKEASGDYLVFLDGDCIPSNKFVAQHERLAEIGYFVNGSRVLLNKCLTGRTVRNEVDLTQQPASFWFKAWRHGECNKLSHLVNWPSSLFRRKASFKWSGIRGCNLGVWRRDFVSVNGFDESFEGWGHEDADFVLRLSHFGIRRKNGFMATEVFHLWHPESTRDQESVNKNRVLQRMSTDVVKAEKGLGELGSSLLLKIKQLTPTEPN